MSDQASPSQIEFIRLDGVIIRVTSWREGAEPGAFELVTISRGSRDAETLDDLFRQPRLTLEIEAALARPVTAVSIDRRTVGEGQAGITRYAVTLADAEAAPDVMSAAQPPTLDERVTSLEAEVLALRALLHTHVKSVRH